MDGIRKRKPKYQHVCPIDLKEVIMSETLWTHATPGLYKARFHRADGEIVEGRKGKQYSRLTIRFQIENGPYKRDGEQWTCDSNLGKGRIVPVWHELDIDANGQVSYSPNWWLAERVQSAKGGNFESKLKNSLQAVKWVVVQRQEKRPAKVVGVAYASEPPEHEWVDSLLS